MPPVKYKLRRSSRKTVLIVSKRAYLAFGCCQNHDWPTLQTLPPPQNLTRAVQRKKERKKLLVHIHQYVFRIGWAMISSLPVGKLAQRQSWCRHPPSNQEQQYQEQSYSLVLVASPVEVVMEDYYRKKRKEFKQYTGDTMYHFTESSPLNSCFCQYLKTQSQGGSHTPNPNKPTFDVYFMWNKSFFTNWSPIYLVYFPFCRGILPFWLFCAYEKP